MSKQVIFLHLWFDKEAKEAAEFYVSAFGGNSKITAAQTISDTPSGDTEMVNFDLWGYGFMSISAGPYFKLNPSISFMLNFDPSQDADAGKKLDALWEKLSEGGTVLMPLDAYPFSKRYGWIQDQFGVSWQLILTDPEGEPRPAIIPSLMFVGDVCGKAEEAMNFYVDVFEDAKAGGIFRYGPNQEPDKEGTVMFEEFTLHGQWFVAMDSAQTHEFNFSEAISLLVKCETQAEIDHYWEKLSAVPEAEQCGWLKDKYGVSWQIVPTAMDKLMGSGDPEQIARVTEAFLQMKKFDIAELERAARGA